jgi:hypothetical protein
MTYIRKEWPLPGKMPEYELRGNQVFRTPWHPDGASNSPLYELRRGFLFRTVWHPNGSSTRPVSELRGDEVTVVVWDDDAELLA